MNNLKKHLLATALAGVLCLGAAKVSFGQAFVNGGFTDLSSSAGGQLGSTVTATGWSTTGYNFVFPSGNAGDGTPVQGSSGTLSLWGSNNGGLTVLPAVPGGGNVVAADGAFEVGSISQAISGLTAGKSYTVSFEWGAAQQKGYDGDTTENWSVDWGAAGLTDAQILADPHTQVTSTVSNPSHSFTGWMGQSYNFTADSTTDTLYFLAAGTPNGEPPFSLLTDVTVVPEPKATAVYMILFAMLVMFGNSAWRRFQKKPATVA